MGTVISGGIIVDGTGAPRRRADLGLEDGRIKTIAEPGELAGTAAKVIQAEGLIVTPGFLDVHCHYDAQVFWDPACTPSPLHGVTTIIGGNCGFTIAPLPHPERDYEYLLTMMAVVE